MLYFQPPLSEKLSQDEVTTQEVKNLALKYVEKCKITRLSVTENSSGVFEIQNLEAIKKEILLNQNNLPEFLSTKKDIKFPALNPVFLTK